MKKVSKIKKCYMGILAFPINVIAVIIGLIVVPILRGIELGRKYHLHIEKHEKGKIYTNKRIRK